MKLSSKRFWLACLAGLLPLATIYAGAPGDTVTPLDEPAAESAAALEEPAAPAPQQPAKPASEFAAPAPTLADFTLELEARYGPLRADALVSLTHDAESDNYIYEIVTKARGMAKLVRSGTGTETSRFEYTAEGLRPLHYVLEDGTDSSDNDTVIDFDWTTDIAHSIYEEEAPKDIPIEPGVLDRLLADIAVILALRAGQEPGGFDVVQRNEIRRYDYTLLGDELLDTPAGEFNTVQYRRQRPGSSRSTLIWFATDADYLPVRIEQQKRGKTSITMVATNVPTNASTNGAEN